MSRSIEIITALDPEVRNAPLESVCRGASLDTLAEECAALDAFRRTTDNLYRRVRSLFFLYAIHRFHLPALAGPGEGNVPFDGYVSLLERRFEQALDIFLKAQARNGPGAAISSGLAAAYRGLGFQTLADQVRRSVRSTRGNQWMFRAGHPSDHPLRFRPDLLARAAPDSPFPILHESTAVRMDLSHSAWSDIFFLGMDFPEGARVLNISVDLAVRGMGGGGPKPPVEAYLRLIDEPLLRLTSVDLQASTDVHTIDGIFNFASDYLGLLKAGLIASGLVPPALEGSSEPLGDVLAQLTGSRGVGLELVTRVNNIPKGSRLAVSTSLLASIVTLCMRATSQIRALEGGLAEADRRLVAARAILGEWLAGSGGGWQDSGGVWPGVKLIEGVKAAEGDPEFGVSRGCLLPRHRILGTAEVSARTRQSLEDSLVLVHGGMAQDVGPILEMVTERYLLRSEAEWRGRQEAIRILDDILVHLREGRIERIGSCTQRNYEGPIQTIIPWAGNYYTRQLIERCRGEFGAGFHGFWMLGGMAGGGMGFLFRPEAKQAAQDRLGAMMREVKGRLEAGVPFAMEPVVYDFAINDRGTEAELLESAKALMPAGYYILVAPGLLRGDPRLLSPSRRADLEAFSAAARRSPEFGDAFQRLFDRLMPHNAKAAEESETLDSVLGRFGFDRAEHEDIQANVRAGRLGLAQNRLPVNTLIEDVQPGDVADATRELPRSYAEAGREAIRSGAVAVVSLAGGIGTRWTKGAGVVKALNPFCRLGGRHRNFVEVHLAKSRKTGRECGVAIPHVFTTSYLTHEAIEQWLAAERNYGYEGPVMLSPGRSVGLRMVPTERDLRFAWEETAHQLLDEQAQKVRENLHETLIGWARKMGEGSDYRDNLPLQCLHPVGHWYEIPNLFRNGVLERLCGEYPRLRYLLVHNIDTVGADLDPALLGYHATHGAAMTAEVTRRYVEDRGGGLARVDGRLRLIESLALPHERVESALSFYNTATMWLDIDQVLAAFRLSRADLGDGEKVAEAVRRVASRMPTYITLKDVKKRWGRGQEDIYPVLQFERLWGDMTALPELRCGFAAVTRERGQQLKEPAQLDGWLRDGSAGYVEGLCEWG